VTEIIIIFAFIVLNGVFVMSELSIASSRKARLQQRINEGDRRAETALKLNQDPNMFLATVQIGITLISVLIGAVGGARLAEPLGQALARFPRIAPYAESISLSICWSDDSHLQGSDAHCMVVRFCD
jgi:putative hemolysin